MMTRSRRETITFRHPFRIKGVDRSLPAGDYEVITDEELIEGLSFASYRRVATSIMVPAAPPRTSTMEMISVGSVDLSDALRIGQVDRTDGNHLHGRGAWRRRGYHDRGGDPAVRRKRQSFDQLLVGDDLIVSGRQRAVDALDAKRVSKRDRFPSRPRHHDEKLVAWDSGSACVSCIARRCAPFAG